MTKIFYYYTAIRNIKLNNVFDLNSSLNINSESNPGNRILLIPFIDFVTRFILFQKTQCFECELQN